MKVKNLVKLSLAVITAGFLQGGCTGSEPLPISNLAQSNKNVDISKNSLPIKEQRWDITFNDKLITYKLGNIYSKTLIEMFYGEKQLEFGQNKYRSLPRQCKNCKFLFACNGECPKNRFCKTELGESGLNYLCKGYYQFFDYVAPYMNFMKNELNNKRPPANIMEAIRASSIQVGSRI